MLRPATLALVLSFTLADDGSVYVQGSFSNTIPVGTDVLVSQGFADIFVAKLTADGDEVWGRRGGGDGTNFSAGLSMFDSAGTAAFLTGYIDGSGDFAGAPFTTQGCDGYFAAISNSGDLVEFQVFGGPGQDAGTGVGEYEGEFAFIGQFRGTASFGDFDLTSAGSSDAYIVSGQLVIADPVKSGAGVPAESRLAAAYPNPFHDRTTLALDVAEAQDVTVELFDVLGRRVVTVHDGPLAVGAHRVLIEANGLPAGVYVIRAEGEAFRFSQRVTLVR